MAVTYSATLMGTGAQPFRSAVRNSLISVAAAGLETLTLVHQLGACPTEIRCMLRSSCATVSGIPLPPPAIGVLNASQATLYFGVGARQRLSSGYVDIISEVTHSIVQ